MKVELVNEDNLHIIPENIAEMTILRNFVDTRASIEKPKPFTNNVEVLKLEIILRKEGD